MRKVPAFIDFPPVWLLLHLAVAWVLSLVPIRFFGDPGDWVGGALVAAGIVVTLLAALEMTKARTTVIPHRDPSRLVTTGVFRFSRNPIYLSDALILTGAILWWDAVLSLPLVAIFVRLITARFIKDEEARLTMAFSAEFDLWAARVNRWIGWRSG